MSIIIVVFSVYNKFRISFNNIILILKGDMGLFLEKPQISLRALRVCVSITDEMCERIGILTDSPSFHTTYQSFVCSYPLSLPN